MLAWMDDLRVGLALKAARIKRRMRQLDVAAAAGTSTTVVSRVEHGQFSRLMVGTLRAIAARLGVSLDLVPRSEGGTLDRVANARHAALAEAVASWIVAQPGWVVAAEVSFSIYGERGIVDLIGWHESTGTVVVIEVKTAIVDVNELIGTLDRKRRLAPQIASARGWRVRSVGTWLVVGYSRTNRRRVSEYRTVLASLLPLDGRSLPSLFHHPDKGTASGIAMWPNLRGAKVGLEFAAPQRVAKRPRSGPKRGPRSKCGWEARS